MIWKTIIFIYFPKNLPRSPIIYPLSIAADNAITAMEVYCINPYCSNPINSLVDLPRSENEKNKFCQACQTSLIIKHRYLCIEELGRGGFGQTFLSIDLDSPNQKKCVIKRLQIPDNLNQADIHKIEETFNQEAKILERLGEKNLHIPNLYDYVKISLQKTLPQKELCLLIQQYIDGEDLQKEFQKKGKFSEDQVQKILGQLLPVLNFIHSEKVIHRDIKPANIVRDRQGTLYLIDFGAVKQLIQGVPLLTSIVFSTPEFAAPEQSPGKPINVSCDLYALAATCIYLLTGEAATTLRNYSMEWQWRDKVVVTDKLAHILDKMLSPNPQNRFQSADEVIAALSSSSQPPSDIPPTRIEPKPPDPVPPDNKGLQKLGYSFAGILTLLLLVFFSRFFPIKLPISAKLLTYQNPTYGFRVNYPQDWNIHEPAGSQYTGIVLEIAPKDQTFTFVEVQIFVEEISRSETLQNYTDLILEAIGNSAQILRSGQTTLDNKPAFEVVYTELDEFKNLEFKYWKIWALSDQKAYLLTYVGEVNQYDQFHEVTQRAIISSLKLP